MTTFASVLYDPMSRAAAPRHVEEPAFFKDFNLDQIVAALTSGRDEYDLKPFFRAPPPDVNTVYYRHEIMKDLDREPVREVINRFSRRMQVMREQIVRLSKFNYKLQKERLFLDAIETYCDAIALLARELCGQELRSRGLLGFRDYLLASIEADDFQILHNETRQIREALTSIVYTLLIRDWGVSVCKYTGETDYGVEVQKTFEKFRQGDIKAFEFKVQDLPEMNHIEAGILDFVAKLHPEIFAHLDRYCSQNEHYLDLIIARFDREIQFFVSYLEFIEPMRRAGLSFCYPKLTMDKQVAACACFDLALAGKLVGEKSPVVTNEFHLSDPERIFVVSGPNQGGKTTFARAFGQMHFLGRLGCLVPGCSARLFFYDQLFSHFEKEEDIHNHRSKLEDDLVRVHGVLEQATPNSIMVLNEIFTSTTLKDAVFLGRQILERIVELDLICVCVTFMDELSLLSERTVSMVSTVVPDNPAQRTYRIVRRTADGRSYAMSIAQKYHLTYETLKERLSS